MKLPSLVRVPKYRRFNFEPRHFDPIKEEIKNRTEIIQRQLHNAQDKIAVQHRITEAFTRDRRRGSAQITGLQVILIVLLSATFVAYLNYGLVALFITGVPILGYILYQRLGVTFKSATQTNENEPETEMVEVTESTRERLIGQMREGRYFARERVTGKKGWYKLLLLAGAGGVAATYYLGSLNGIAALLTIFILLILFIKESSKG